MRRTSKSRGDASEDEAKKKSGGKRFFVLVVLKCVPRIETHTASRTDSAHSGLPLGSVHAMSQVLRARAFLDSKQDGSSRSGRSPASLAQCNVCSWCKLAKQKCPPKLPAREFELREGDLFPHLCYRTGAWNRSGRGGGSTVIASLRRLLLRTTGEEEACVGRTSAASRKLFRRGG